MEQKTRTLTLIEKEREKIYRKQRAIIRRTGIRCEECGCRRRLSMWKFVQTKHYVEPYSCTAGDYWLNSEPQLCYIECPKCNAENYLYTHPQRDEIINLLTLSYFDERELFHEVVERER